MEKFNENLKIVLISIIIADWGVDCSPSFANFLGLGETFSRFPPPGAATVEHYFVCVGSNLPKPYSKCAYDYKPKLMSIKMIDYNTFKINTNIILLFNIIFSNLFYTIIFINYCSLYKLYIQCWPYQIFVHGALHGF